MYFSLGYNIIRLHTMFLLKLMNNTKQNVDILSYSLSLFP